MKHSISQRIVGFTNILTKMFLKSLFMALVLQWFMILCLLSNKCTCNFVNDRYIATINGEVNKRQLVAISKGTVVEGVHCTPDLVELLPQQPDISRPRLRIVVCYSL